MNRNIKYIIIAFLVFSLVLSIIFIAYFKTADVTAVYTRNNLSWNNADAFEDGSVKVDLAKGKTTIRLTNDVKGRIGYNIYLYSDEEKELLRKYLERILTYKNGKYYNVKDKADWIMVWWKKES